MSCVYSLVVVRTLHFDNSSEKIPRFDYLLVRKEDSGGKDHVLQILTCKTESMSESVESIYS